MPVVYQLLTHKQTFVTTGGLPLVGGTITTYITGTTTPKTTYTDPTGVTSHANPITLDSRGEMPNGIHGTTGAYKIVLKDSGGATIWTGDPIYGDSDPLSPASTLTALANTSDTTLGDALIGAKRTETGADATTLHAINQARPLYVPADFTGGTFTQALQDAVASGARRIQLTGHGTLTATITLQSYQELDLGSYVVTKGANIDMFDMSADNCKIFNGDLDGAGYTPFTGRGIIISSGSLQRIHGLQVRYMDGYCLEFTAANAGSVCSVQGMGAGGIWQRQNATLPAIKLPASESGVQGTRYFSGIFTGGGSLIDVSGGNMTFMDMCNFTTLTLSSASANFHLTNSRPAAAITIDGVQTHISGCTIGGNVTVNGTANGVYMSNNNAAGSTLTLNSGAVGVRIDDTNNFSSVVDNSASVTNHLYTEADFTPVWGSDGTAPALGNGTLTGRYTRRGKHIRACIELTMGSTTTYGTGAYKFTMPTALQFNVKRQALGSVRITDSGTAWYVGIARTGSGAAPVIYVTINAAGGDMSGTNPHTFAANDVVEIDIEWEIG